MTDSTEPTIVVIDPTKREVIMTYDEDPRAEIRDSETGEVIFPAVKGPLKLITGGKP